MVAQTRPKLTLDNINRSKVARDTGMTLAHISRVFSGQRRPSLHAARLITRSLGCTLDELEQLLLSIVKEPGGTGYREDQIRMKEIPGAAVRGRGTLNLN